MSPKLKENSTTSPDGEGRPAVWQQSLAAVMVPKGEKSWDLMERYLLSFDDVLEKGSINDAVALVVHYVETLLGEKCDSKERAMIAKTVRKHGKVSIYGWDKALLTTEEDTPRERMRYAQGVINRVIAERENDAAAS